jgi:hypothetical protein
LRRTDSLTRVTAVALAAVALLCAGLIAGVAAGKKKHQGGGKVTVLSTEQHAIVDAGAVKVRVKGGGGKRVVVDGIQGGSAIPLTRPAKVKPGKAMNVPLSASGKTAIGGCSIDALRGRLVKSKGKKRGKKSAGGGVTPLVKDLAICSVGSENPTARPYYGPPIDTSNADRCDFLDPAVCMQPFPNDYFTKTDASTDTGRRLNFQAASMPHNTHGVAIDPTDFNHADGFSPGNEIIIHIPEVTSQAAFDQTGFVSITDEHRYADANQPVVVINTDTGQRQPVFAELDALPAKFGGGPGDVNLIIRPLKNFDEGGHYVVALRNVKDAAGAIVPPPMPFRVYRDRLITGDPAIENRRAHMEDLISELQGDGIQRANLYMAWDFTVASENSLAGRALALRNAALAELGDTTPGDGVVDGSAPTFHITSVTDNTTSDPTNPILKQIDGELTNVPCYLHPDCKPPARLQYDAPPNQDTPDTTPNGFADDPNAATTGVEFRCIVPRSTVAGGTVHPAKVALYGHGLLGNYTEVNGASRLANQANMVFCATKWAGFSSDDVATVASALGDLSNFSKLTDRMLQGFVNFVYLGRALDNSNGFRTNANFQVDADGNTTPDGSAIESTNNLYYEGISQGAIMGGALTALSPDFTQSVLDVTGMNYSTLLSRSTDSAQYLELPSLGLYDNYPNQVERQLIFSLMELLWDRGEADGYAQHMTDDPLPQTPEHHVLLQAAVGDFQVSNLTAEVEARTIGAKVYDHLDPGDGPGGLRHWDVDPFVGLTPLSSFPFSGPAALVYYDGGPIDWFNNAAANTPAGMECSHGDPTTSPCQGTALAPTNNTAPIAGTYGADPHSYPRRAADALQQITDWLQPNGFINPCTDPGPVIRPCYANGWTGP